MTDAVKRVEESLQAMALTCSVDMHTWSNHCDAIRVIIEENKRLRSLVETNWT